MAESLQTLVTLSEWRQAKLAEKRFRHLRDGQYLLAVMGYETPRVREALMQFIEASLPQPAQPLSIPDTNTLKDLLPQLTHIADQQQAVLVLLDDALVEHSATVGQALNNCRDHLTRNGWRVIVLLPQSLYFSLFAWAGDFLSVANVNLCFTDQQRLHEIPRPDPDFRPQPRIDYQQSLRQLAELRKQSDVNPDVLINAYRSAISKGYAVNAWRTMHRLIDELLMIADQNSADQAFALHYKAKLLIKQGESMAALTLLQDTLVPLYEQLDDAKQKAVALGNIADILQARGELDEALQIRHEEELPVYERLGEVREKAITMGKIADILQARGEFDEALRIRHEEELPVFERLGEVREKAITMGKIADILQARGELDEALRIRHEEELPVYERLGEVRAKAITMGQIADILEARGELDEALRIRHEEELPVYERLGEVRTKAVTMSQIADILQIQGKFAEALHLLRTEVLPAVEHLGAVNEQAVAHGCIADVLLLQGNLTDSLHLRRTEELPVYEQLGHKHNLVVGHTCLAINLLMLSAENHRAEAENLLRQALLDATEMGLTPVVLQIEKLLVAGRESSSADWVAQGFALIRSRRLRRLWR